MEGLPYVRCSTMEMSYDRCRDVRNISDLEIKVGVTYIFTRAVRTAGSALLRYFGGKENTRYKSNDTGTEMKT